MSAVPVVEPVAQDAGLEKKLADVSLDNDTPQMTGTTTTAVSTQPSSVAVSLREKPFGPRQTPIVDPHESAKLPSKSELTADQQSKYESLLEEVKSWKDVPSTKGKEGPITESEMMWLTRECLLRYLRATKWSTADASKRLLGTLTWRREYGVEDLTGEYLSPENETGKQFILGYDIAGRPCQYLNPGRQNTEVSPRQVQHLVFMVERVTDLMIPGQETLTLLINFKSSKTRTNTSPGIGQGREVLNILQTHYPERLGRALIINIPWVVWGFFKLITPFIDPLTKEKLKFNEDMRQYVPPQHLWTEFQGDVEFEYDHEIYWPALLKLSEEKHAQMTERWVKGGKIYGESEVYLKGGNTPSLGQAPVESKVSKKGTEVTAAEQNVESSQASEKGKENIPVEPKQEA